MELMEAIKGRRSIRKYKSDPLREEDIEKVLEAARWAPSWANTQCWQFVVVRDAEVKESLSQTLAPGNPATSAIKDAPVVIVACAERGRSGFKSGAVVTDKGNWWFMFDVALATQNLTLEAYSLGLGTVHVGWFDAQKVAQILNVPESTSVVEMTPLGYPAREAKTPSRKALSEIVHYERY
jgi:nitroreductase